MSGNYKFATLCLELKNICEGRGENIAITLNEPIPFDEKKWGVSQKGSRSGYLAR